MKQSEIQRRIGRGDAHVKEERRSFKFLERILATQKDERWVIALVDNSHGVNALSMEAWNKPKGGVVVGSGM